MLHAKTAVIQRIQLKDQKFSEQYSLDNSSLETIGPLCDSIASGTRSEH